MKPTIRLSVAELERDPHPSLARARSTAPVCWIPDLDRWLVTSHRVAVAVLRDADRFTVDDPRFSTARVLGPSMLSLDGPAHRRHRAPFGWLFRRRSVEREHGDWIRAEARRLTDGIAERGEAELRSTVAGPIAATVITRLLDLVEAEPATVLRWYRGIVSAVDDVSAGREPSGSSRRAVAALRARVDRTIDESPQSALAAAVGAGGLTRAEVFSNAAVIMFGAIETAEGMIANALFHLLTHPGELAAITQRRALLAAAVEESLRLEPAAAVVDRYATVDVDLAGSRIDAGDLVSVSLAAANRDPEVFAAPDRYDLSRPNTAAHLAFAQGPHACPGLHLARLETEAVISAVLDTLHGIRLVPHRTEPPRGLIFRKPPTLVATWDPRPASRCDRTAGRH